MTVYETNKCLTCLIKVKLSCLHLINSGFKKKKMAYEYKNEHPE